VIKQFLLVVSLILVFSSCQNKTEKAISSTESQIKSDSISIGFIQRIRSKILNEAREIVISLPKEYHKSQSHYPVLYLTDGFQNIEHVRGSVELLTRTGNIPPVIIVGIKSINRVKDFTFSPSKQDDESGGGKQFLTFLESELIPYIDEKYRTNNFRILEGHSLGGLFAASVLLEKPELFQSYIMMSPAFWWNGEELTKKAETFFASHQELNTKLFFGIATSESSKERGMRKELTNFIDVMEANKPQKVYYEHREFEDEGHMSSPFLSNYYGLKFVFSDLKYSEEFMANYSDEAFLEKEQDIINKYGESAKRTAESYYELGYAIYQKNLSGAITVFKRSVEVYSYDINLITTLAILYEGNKEIENAIDTYKKAIEVSKKYNFGSEEKYQKEIDRLGSLVGSKQ